MFAKIKRLFSINNKKILYILLAQVAVFLLLSIPFPSGKSTYAYHELIRDLEVVRKIDQGVIVRLGPESSLGGFHFGPAYYYLMYPVVKILNFQPYSLALTSTFFLLLSLLALFVLVKNWFNNELAAVTASAIFAISSVSIQLTKYGSNPNFIPFFTILFFYALKKYIDKDKSDKHALVLGLCAGVLTQLHAVTLILVPVTLIASVFVFKIRPQLKHFFLFSIVAVITYLPYIKYEFDHGLSNLKNLLALSGAGSPQPGMYFTHILEFASSMLNPFISLHNFFNVTDSDIGGRTALILVSVFLALVYPLFKYNHMNREFWNIGEIGITPVARKLLIIWGLTSLLYVTPFNSTKDYHYYYFFFHYPLVLIMYSCCLFWLFKKGYHLLGLYFVAAFVLFQSYQIYLLFDTIMRLN